MMIRILLALFIALTVSQSAYSSGYSSSGGSTLPTPGTSGNALVSNGTSWVSGTPSGTLPAGVSMSLSKRIGWIQCIQPSNTAFNAVGSTTITHSGLTPTNAFGTDGGWLNSLSNGTSGSLYGWSLAAPSTFQQPLDVTFRIKTGANAADITVSRLYVGLSSNTTSTLTNTDTPGAAGLHGAWVCYSPPTTDGTAFWRTLTANGASQTRFTTTTAIAADTVYLVRVVYTPGVSVAFYVNGTLVKTETATLPSGANNAALVVLGQTNENVAKNVKAERVYWESDSTN